MRATVNGSNAMAFFFRRLRDSAAPSDLRGGGGGRRRGDPGFGDFDWPAPGLVFGTPGFDSHEKGTEEESVVGRTGEGSAKGELRRVDDDEDEDGDNGDADGDEYIGEKLRVLIESSLFTASVLHLSGGGFVLLVVGAAPDKDDNEEEESMVGLDPWRD